MDLAQALRTVLRHWVILTVGVVLSLAAAAGAYLVTPRTYEASSQVMVLLPPTAGNAATETSPFLYMPAGLTTLARIVAMIPNTPEYRRDMAAAGYYPTYTVTVQPQNPTAVITVEGLDPVTALRTRDELMVRFAAELDRVQQEERVPARQWAHTRVLEASNTVEASSGDRFRSAAMAGVAGVVLTLLVLALAENRSRRRARRAKVAASPADAPADRAVADEPVSNEADLDGADADQQDTDEPDEPVRHSSETDTDDSVTQDSDEASSGADLSGEASAASAPESVEPADRPSETGEPLSQAQPATRR